MLCGVCMFSYHKPVCAKFVAQKEKNDRNTRQTFSFRSGVHPVKRSPDLFLGCWYHSLEVLLSSSLFVVVYTVVLFRKPVEKTKSVPWTQKRDNVELSFASSLD